MKVGKRSISTDLRRSGDVQAATEVRLRRQALADFLSDWQAKRGKITVAELAQARAELGPAGVKRR